MHAFIPFMHGPTKYDYSRIRDIHIQSRDASLEHHTKSHPNTLQLYISPAGGGCFPHSRRILEALELAGAAGAAGAAARLEPARGDATGVGRGELSQPYCWVAACTRRNSLKEPKDPKMHCRATHAYLLWCHVSQFFLEIHL